MSDAPTALFGISMPQAEGHAGFAVRGHSLGLIRDGWVVVVEAKFRPPTDHLIEELCVVKTKAGELLVRVIRKGRQPGTYDLLSATGPQALDVEVVWAERIVCILPRELSGEEAAALYSVAEAAS